MIRFGVERTARSSSRIHSIDLIVPGAAAFTPKSAGAADR